MPKSNLKPPVHNGVKLITVNEAAELIGLSTWRIRERCSKRPTRRGGFIPSYKIGGHVWLHPDELKRAVYGQQSTAIIEHENDDCPV